MKRAVILAFFLLPIVASAQPNRDAPPTVDVNVENDLNNPVPVVPVPEVFTVREVVGWVQQTHGIYLEKSYTFYQDALLLTVDIKLDNVFFELDTQVCNTSLKKNEDVLISRSFFDRNMGSTGARSDQAVNLSLAPGVRFEEGDSLIFRVSGDGSNSLCTGVFSLFLQAL